MADVLADVERIAAESRFSGAVRVDFGGEVALAQAYGLADRRHGIPNQIDTQFAIASGGKGLTALTVMSLVEQGLVELSTGVRSILDADLPLVGDVTIEQLLGHTSGIGDYIDEDFVQEIEEHVLDIPLHRLLTAEAFLPMLDARPAKFPPGERFSYCNSGFAILAIVIERVMGAPFQEVVLERVCQPAGLASTAFLPSDDLPARAAIGYLTADSTRTNVLHLPVLGNGDGGIYSTVDDVHTLWAALYDGAVVSHDRVQEMVRPRSTAAESDLRYGLGFWLHGTGAAVMLEGYDAGVSFRTAHDPERHVTFTVVSNWSDGAWPLTKHLGGLLAEA